MARKLTVPAQLWSSTLWAPEWVDARVLAAATAETYTVPANVSFVVLSSATGFYINLTGTAAVPGADVTDGTASFYVPASIQCRVPTGSSISMIITAGGVVTIAGYNQ